MWKKVYPKGERLSFGIDREWCQRENVRILALDRRGKVCMEKKVYPKGERLSFGIDREGKVWYRAATSTALPSKARKTRVKRLVCWGREEVDVHRYAQTVAGFAGNVVDEAVFVA